MDVQLASILAGVDSWTILPSKQKTAYKYRYSLQKIIKHQIGIILSKKKQENGWISESNKRKDRSLSMVFMKIAKEELSKEDYSRILSIAQSKIKGD